MDIKNSRLVNITAKGVLGVYLIHQNEYFRSALWNKIINLDYYYKYASPIKFVLVLILGSILTFIICTVLDLLRLYILEKPLYRHVHIHSKFIQNINNILNNSDLK